MSNDIPTDDSNDDTEGNHLSRGRIQPTDDAEGHAFRHGLTPADGTEEPADGKFRGTVRPAEDADDVEGHSQRGRD